MEFRQWLLREMGHVMFDKEPLNIGGRNVSVIDFRFEDLPPEFSHLSPLKPFSARLGPSKFLNYAEGMSGEHAKTTTTPTPLYPTLPDDWFYRAHVLYADGDEKMPQKWN